MQFEFLFDRRRPAQSDHEWLRVGTRHIRLRFARHPRARRYVLRLCADGSTRVTIPRGGSYAEGRRFVNRNLGWLEKQLLRQASRSAQPKVWTAGTEILFRGEKVPLQVTEEQRTAVVHFAGEVVARIDHLNPVGTRSTASQTSPEEWNTVERVPTTSSRHSNYPPARELAATAPPLNLRPFIEKHLWQLASHELPARVAELAKEHGFQVQRVSVRNQRSRWGSCTKRATISLNWRLVQTPLLVRDYIILHELAHLKEMNHSRRFWREVARLCPGFAQAERWLKDHAGLFR